MRLPMYQVDAFTAEVFPPWRGGALRCVVDGERVRISGSAVLYLEGAISV